MDRVGRSDVRAQPTGQPDQQHRANSAGVVDRFVGAVKNNPGKIVGTLATGALYSGGLLMGPAAVAGMAVGGLVRGLSALRNRAPVLSPEHQTVFDRVKSELSDVHGVLATADLSYEFDAVKKKFAGYHRTLLDAINGLPKAAKDDPKHPLNLLAGEVKRLPAEIDTKLEALRAVNRAAEANNEAERAKIAARELQEKNNKLMKAVGGKRATQFVNENLLGEVKEAQRKVNEAQRELQELRAAASASPQGASPSEGRQKRPREE